MLNSGSCETLADGPGLALTGRIEQIRRAFGAGDASHPEGGDLDEVARHFASVFYTALVRQMQRTLAQDDEEQSVLADGARGFFTMFMPRAMARSKDDPLAGYLRQALESAHGERLDETG